MTLVLALACADGLVLASDSQGTSSTSGQPTKVLAEKLYCPWTNMAWGAAGSVGVIQDVGHALRIRYPGPDRVAKHLLSSLRKELVETVTKVVRPIVLEQSIKVPGADAPLTSYLFVGYAQGEPFIFEIATNLVLQDHMATGYAAIGSADIFPYFALASLAHFRIRERTLVEAKILAYRVLSDALNVAAFGIGPPIQMIEVTKPNGPADPPATRKLPAEELRMLEDKVSEWKAIESETLSTLLGLAPSPPEVPGDPTP